jgi:hypothetical protein
MRQGRCEACSREFAEEERHFSLLRIGAEAILRVDLCRTCFPHREAEEEVVWWRTIHRPPGRRGLALDFDALEALFHDLSSRSGGERLAELRYLLGLLLLRKRRLKMVRVVRAEGGGEALVLRRPRRTEEIRLEVHDLPPERVAALEGELAALFEGAELAEAVPEAPPQEGGEDAAAVAAEGQRQESDSDPGRPGEA